MPKLPPEMPPAPDEADNSTGPGKPAWLRRRLPVGGNCAQTRQILRQNRLCTVCEAARCPNRWECFSRRTATFMIMGERCTRNCRFCAVPHGSPAPLDSREPGRVADAARKMELEHVVVTSVTRDDLPDKGAGCFAETIREIRRQLPRASVEVLVPDFCGSKTLLRQVLDAGPDVFNHNIETVSALYERVRPEADYRRSLDVLAEAAALRPDIPIKSGIMLGLGEHPEAVARSLADLLAADCSMLTMGQYLQPTREHLPVVRYVRPEIFEDWRQYALDAGFAAVAAGPLVRSSYRAREMFRAWQEKRKTGTDRQ